MQMTRSPADLEDVNLESAPFLRLIDAALEPADPRLGGSPVTLPAAAFAVGVFDAGGAPRSQDDRFAEWFDPLDIAEASRDWLRGPRDPALIPVKVRSGATTVVLLAKNEAARAWTLPEALRLPLNGGAEAFTALAYRPFEDRGLAARAVASWRLTPVEARTVLGLLSTGDLIAGAKFAGVGYETARKALKLAMRKAKALRQADLVRLMYAAVGAGDLQFSQAPQLSLALKLSEVASGASLLLALGLTRTETARTLQISEHTLKDVLKLLYDRFQLRSSTDLSRLTTEAIVLLGMVTNSNLTVGASWSARRPLRFVNRTAEAGRVAFSDFGPVSGEPTLLFHSATTGSLLDRGLVRALQDKGMRPIAVERPGFGLTDPPDGDPLGTAVDDLVTLMDALRLKQVLLLARGGESVALEFGLRHPDRLARAVLINPFTPYVLDSRWDGFMNSAKRTFMRHPHLIEPISRFLAKRLTPSALERLLRDALAGSAPDLEVLRNPHALEDYVESARLAPLRTTWGFVHEQRSYLAWRPQTLPSGSDWTRVVGIHDVLYRPGDADDLWAAALPGHRLVRVQDGGRLLHASHPELMAEELSRTR
jgi:pimeloyl-ACP methyl ester carboxylesterase/DNA-binding CsgD family transcriptional regulator